MIPRSPFVGRASEYSLLCGLLEEASCGRGALVLLGGEPGVGKTRLAEEVATEARSRGFRAFTGHCSDAAGGTPYLPFIELMEEILRVVPPTDLREALDETAAQVARLVPELRRAVPDLPEPGNAQPEDGRRLLFNAIRDSIHRVSLQQPLVLILDDLHWADESTLALLQHIAQRLAEIPVLVVATYRDAELAADRPLAKTVPELIRQRLAHDLVLRRLPEEGVADMFLAYGRSVPPSPLVSIVYRETDGNPFFVEEVLRHLAEEGKLLDAKGSWTTEVAIGETDVPRSISLVLEQRLARMSAECRRLLASAAVIGREFSFPLLEALGDVGPDNSLDAVEEAVRAGLIHDASRGSEARFSFSHELVRQTLLGGLSLPRRQRLHAKVAETIERVYAPVLDPNAAELAHHYRQSAGDPVRAVAWSLRAGDAASRVFAWREAVAHYDGALAASESSRILDNEQRCEAVLSLGEALLWAGESQRLYTVVAPEAFELAMVIGDHARAARASWQALRALRFQFAAWAAAQAEYRVWAERLDKVAGQASVARVHADLAMATLAARRPDEAHARCMRALALARELGAGPAAVCSVFAPFAAFCQGPRFEADLRQLSREVGSLATTPEAVRDWGVTDAVMGAAAEASKWGDRREQTRLQHLVVRSGERAGAIPADQVGPFVDAERLFLEGDLEGAARVASAMSSASSAAISVYPMIAGFRPFYLLGRIWDLPGWPSPPVPTAQAGIRALQSLSLGQREEAREELLRWREAAGGTGAPDLWATYVLVMFLEAAVLLEDAGLASWFATPLWSVGAVTTGLHPTIIRRHLGAAAALAGQPGRARAYFERALAEATEMRFRPEVALTHLGIAELLVDHYQMDRHEALVHVEFALSEFEAMKMAPSLERARPLNERLAAVHPRPTYPDGLSEREVEVLRLLAAGRTNRQIAESLFISLNTVTRHITHIFEKTGAANRADAASYANRQGLAG